MAYDLIAKLAETERLTCPILKRVHDNLAMQADIDACERDEAAAREAEQLAAAERDRANRAYDKAMVATDTARRNLEAARAKLALANPE